MQNRSHRTFADFQRFRGLVAPEAYLDLVEGRCIGRGWMDILYDLLFALEHLPTNGRRSFEVVQVKEKFGELRVYLSKGHAEASSMIDQATALSRATCEGCGCASKVRSHGGWFTTMCNACRGACK